MFASSRRSSPQITVPETPVLREDLVSYIKHFEFLYNNKSAEILEGKSRYTSVAIGILNASKKAVDSAKPSEKFHVLKQVVFQLNKL